MLSIRWTPFTPTTRPTLNLICITPDNVYGFSKPEYVYLIYFFLLKKNQYFHFSLNLQEFIEKLQGKIRAFKKQVEDAEEIAALNLAKYKKAQSELEDAEERANLSEQALARVRAKSILSGQGANVSHLFNVSQNFSDSDSSIFGFQLLVEVFQELEDIFKSVLSHSLLGKINQNSDITNTIMDVDFRPVSYI